MPEDVAAVDKTELARRDYIPLYGAYQYMLRNGEMIVEGMAFLTDGANTTGFTVDWSNEASGARKENIMWVCTDAGNP